MNSSTQVLVINHGSLDQSNHSRELASSCDTISTQSQSEYNRWDKFVNICGSIYFHIHWIDVMWETFKLVNVTTGFKKNIILYVLLKKILRKLSLYLPQVVPWRIYLQNRRSKYFSKLEGNPISPWQISIFFCKFFDHSHWQDIHTRTECTTRTRGITGKGTKETKSSRTPECHTFTGNIIIWIQ